MVAMGTAFTIATPAFPDNHRTVFKGYLFAGDGLLNEGGMQNHPLTPMTDPNLVRVLQAQCKGRVGLIDYRTVALGEQAIRSRIAQLRDQGVGVAIVDAISNDDLIRLGPALKDMPLVTAGSGVAIGLPMNFGLAPNVSASQLPVTSGLKAVVSGSCSVATNAQVAAFRRAGYPALGLDPLQMANGANVVEQALAWATPLLQKGPVLVYSTDESAGREGSPSPTWRGKGGCHGRALHRCHCPGLGPARRAPVGSGGWRDLGRLRAGPGHQPNADRSAN